MILDTLNVSVVVDVIFVAVVVAVNFFYFSDFS